MSVISIQVLLLVYLIFQSKGNENIKMDNLKKIYLSSKNF